MSAVRSSHTDPTGAENNIRVTTEPEKLPPAEEETEQALLGSILLDPSVLQGLPQMEPSMFWLGKHQVAFSSMQQLIAMGQSIDYVSLVNQLEQQSKLEAAGGAAYIVSLMNWQGTPYNAPTYYRRVLRNWVQRRLLVAAGQIADMAYNNHRLQAEELVMHAEQILQQVELPSIEEGVVIGKAMDSFMPELERRLADPKQVYGMPTGLDIDSDTGGMLPQDLWICAGDPGKGKTALSLTVATNAAMADPEKNGVVLFSLEMSLEQLLYRWTAAAANIDSRLLRQGRLRAEERRDLPGKVAKLQGLPIYIFDRGQDTGSVRANVARLQQKVPIRLVIIDYSRLLRDRIGDDNETSRLGFISQQGKELAKDNKLTVWLNHVLVRAAYNKKPSLADLGWSYQMGYDVDVMLFPWFDEGRKDLAANLGVGKSRNGPAGHDVPMIFDAPMSVWRNPVKVAKQRRLEEVLQ